MFEKEAEEYAGNREVCDLLDAISEDLQNYDYGTVAHYNIDPLVEECFKDGAEFGYNKANEWHYVKDGLPIITEKGRWLNLILKDRRVESFWWNFKSVPQRVIDNFRADVIAWKEIVLPELTKEV